MEYTNDLVQNVFNTRLEKEKADNNYDSAVYDLWHAFHNKNNWRLFLKRHGLDLDAVCCNCSDYGFYFRENNKMVIKLEDEFKGEYSDYYTEEFDVSELCDFLNSDDYYGPKLKRLENLKLVWKNKKEKEDKERRKKLYEQLKEEFEN